MDSQSWTWLSDWAQCIHFQKWAPFPLLNAIWMSLDLQTLLSEKSHPTLPEIHSLGNNSSYLMLNFFSSTTTYIIPKLNPFVSVSSVQFTRSVVSDSLQPHGLQHARPPCPSPTPGVYSNSCPLSQWCHPTISASVIPFSSRLLSASGSFQMSQFFPSGGQSTGVSALVSVFPMNAQDRSPLGWPGWISLQSKGLPRVFSNTTVQKHQFFGAQLSSQSNSHIHTWPQEKP